MAGPGQNDQSPRDGHDVAVPHSGATVASFAASPLSVAQARQFVLRVLGPDRAEQEVVKLLVSELATNAVSHAQTRFEVAVSVGEITHVEVSDASPLLPRLAATDERDDGGVGLRLLNELALVWGIRRTATGKTVWFDVGPNPR